jgi:hypothetical protein
MCLGWRQITRAEIAAEGAAHLETLNAELARVRTALHARHAGAGERPAEGG